MINTNELDRILIKIGSGNASAEDMRLFNELLKNANDADYQELIIKYQAFVTKNDVPVNPDAALVEKIETKLNHYDQAQHDRRWINYRYLSGIAATIFLVCAAIYYYNPQSPTKINYSKVKPVKKEILPGGNKAILILADGSRISLDDSATGEIAKQSGITITKTAKGELIYSIAQAKTSVTNIASYNTIETPKGGQYQINLPDGTKVWLNAASSLRFPTLFSGKQREVTLTGEAYFEVAKNKEMPFEVITHSQVIKVLGTHFNVNSYVEEDAVKTTLIEGSVKVTKANDNVSVLLKPGQQSQLSPNSNQNIKVLNVNADEEVAWKSGYFNFNYTTIPIIMRNIARWYNVEINYNGNIPQDRFVGSVSRYNEVKDVLEVLELTGRVHFKIEGRRIIVIP